MLSKDANLLTRQSRMYLMYQHDLLSRASGSMLLSLGTELAERDMRLLDWNFHLARQ